ncbi:hypothetical protein LTR28_007824 [Elasticomyces elasticus]|nr:hypothetical protein LTR28_007824 [Elasticomyces elasticus]
MPSNRAAWQDKAGDQLDSWFNWLKFPLILGINLVGEGFEVGSSVVRFETGDPYPSVSPKSKHTGTVVLIWGGSSAIGSNGIQLAVAAGHTVFVTGSPNNLEYLKKLGATGVVNHKNANAVEDIVSATNNEDFVGIFQAAGYVRSRKNSKEVPL